MKESDFLYYYIKGCVAIKGDGFVVVENGGIGYKLSVSETTRNELASGSEALVYTYLYVREDIMELYGFSTIEEKNMFMNLIAVSGIGAKAAISVLSIGTPAKIAAAIITNDANTIKKAQGIGAKTAQRIILELKDKISSDEIDIPEDIPTGESDSISEVINALIVLGYSEREAAAAVRGIDASMDTESMIKAALKNML